MESQSRFLFAGDFHMPMMMAMMCLRARKRVAPAG
jgi:hypothetical protein